jgi:hypothetical protein
MQQHSQIQQFQQNCPQVQDSLVTLTISLLICCGSSGLEVINRLIISKNVILGGRHCSKPKVTYLIYTTATTPDTKTAK